MFGELVAKKANNPNGTKIVLISVYDLDGELVKALEENNYIAKYVQKPIHLADLIKTVTSTIY
jgi:CheY-like chemotaxis protein